MTESSSLALIPLFPLIGSVAAFLVGRIKHAAAGIIATGAAALSFCVVLKLFLTLDHGDVYIQNVFNWMTVGNLNIPFGLRFDQLTSVMCLVVTGIGSLIHLYSTAYMSHDASVHRFFSYLNLFLFSMLLLVMGSNLLVMFVGWEGVGLCSYLLIGFWFTNASYASAGRKAFVVNRIGDAGFLLAIFLLYWHLGTVDFGEITRALTDKQGFQDIATLIALGLFVGATGKSAQIPLFVWLPDAMAGPTPVSALIHAATMVTAGVYMMARLHVVFDLAPEVQALVVIVAVLTAFVAAFTALTQNDIKKVLAYSTVSQLGFMFMAAGSGAYWVALFHVVTHAFFKACLFLGAGSVIHGCHHEQDMRHMGGLRKYMPITFATYLISTLAIAGICPLSGYYSKHAILAALEHNHNESLHTLSRFILPLASITAFMTAFYMMRSVMMTFFGSYRGHAHPHESPLAMTIPLMVLAGLAVIGGFLPIGSYVSPILPYLSHHPESIVEGIIHSWVGIAGVLLAVILYQFAPNIPGLVMKASGFLGTLSKDKFFFDEIYGALIVRPLERAARFSWQFIDQSVIDGVVNGTGACMEVSGEIVRSTQTGQLRHYALFMFIGTVVVTFFYLVLQ